MTKNHFAQQNYKHIQETLNKVLNDQLKLKSDQIYDLQYPYGKEINDRQPVMCQPLLCKLCVNNVIVLKFLKCRMFLVYSVSYAVFLTQLERSSEDGTELLKRVIKHVTTKSQTDKKVLLI